MSYECLLAGLPELKVDAPLTLSMESLLEQLDQTLTTRDKALLDMLRLQPDDASITELIAEYDDNILSQPAWWEDARHLLSEQDLRTSLTYRKGLHCRNAFLRSWFAYNLDLNNVMVAAICRKHNRDVSKMIVGDNEVAKILRRNLPQKDFGLNGILDDFQQVVALLDETNLMDREKKLDALRFAWLEEHTRFFIFSIENVLAYWLQAQMLHRWSILTVEQGEKVFRDIVADMKKGASEQLQ